MHIALFHNRYRIPGGEDRTVEFEHELLESAGHRVSRFEVSNEDVFARPGVTALRSTIAASWNRQAYREAKAYLSTRLPDVGHVHNWFPLLSPSIYAAHRELGIPVVQTLHNYRLGCAWHPDSPGRIMVDREGRLGEPGRSGRDKAVDRHRRWVEAAARLGCMAIRVNAHSEGPADEQRRLTADGIRALTEHAATHDMSVLIENHGGLSCDGSWLASLIRAVDHPRCGSLPDFGNFEADGRRYDAYGGVRELMPFAGGVSAKSRAFDDRGDERTIDYRRMLRTVVASGYRGYVGIEYEGRELPELEGVRRTKRLLERVGTELAGA